MKTTLQALMLLTLASVLSNCTTNVQPAVVNPPVTATTTTTQATLPYTGETVTTKKTTTTTNY